MIANQILNADDESPSISDAPSRLTWCRHSPMCNCTSWMRHLARARNPYSRWWLWIPGSLVSLAPRNDE
jgi:hypothetical protein